MITHVVFFKLKDRSAQSVQEAKGVLENMKGKIDVLRYIEVGTDVLHSERSYDLVLITKFDSMKGLDAYQVDPVHGEVKKYVAVAAESVAVVDYES